jgi:hypothetical protein
MRACLDCKKKLIVGNNWYVSSQKNKQYRCIKCHTSFYRSKYNPIKNKIKVRKYDDGLKFAAMNAYGGLCSCCGEKELYFLTIDHINGDGFLDRKNKLVGTKMYRWMRKNNYPDKDRFRVLCYNCNYARGAYGFCSHENFRDDENCLFCDAQLLDMSLYCRNYHKNFHLFFKMSGINVCIDCGIRHKLKINKDIDIKKKHNSRITKLNRRTKIIKKYGEMCECCGELNYIFLTIDHINGVLDLNDRKSSFYANLINNNFPKDNYRLLCYNCNCSRGHFGKCPHELISSYSKESKGF